MPTAVFVLKYAGLFLMEQRHMADQYTPGQWLFPGGKMQPGETPLAALLREIQEELRLSPPDGRLEVGVLDDRDAGPVYLIPEVPEFLVYPFAIHRLLGEIPAVTDAGHRLEWRAALWALSSPVRGVRQIARLATLYRGSNWSTEVSVPPRHAASR